MSGLHSLARRVDQRVGRCDDVVSGAIVVDQVGGFWPVICFETADELHRSTVEGVDVLIVVAYCEEGELAILIFQSPSGKCRYQLVLIRANVLVFIYQEPAETREEPFPLIVCFLRSSPSPRSSAVAWRKPLGMHLRRVAGVLALES